MDFRFKFTFLGTKDSNKLFYTQNQSSKKKRE